MKIVTTPMCEKILEFAGISDYKVNKNPDEENGDLAILLSESKTEMDSLSIKLNTFSQIKDSIIKVSKLNNPLSFEETENIFSEYSLAKEWIQEDRKKEFQKKNSNIKIKVYSKFIKDIVEDMGFFIVESDDTKSDFDYIIFPDYIDIDDLRNNLNESTFISVPTHSNVPKDPIKRAEMRYSLLSDLNII